MTRKTREGAQETKEKLLESALDIMSSKTFSSVSMSEIAEGIGFSKGATYWHFKNKNDLLVNLIENLCHQTEKELSVNNMIPEDMTFDDIKIYFKTKMIKTVNNERFKKIHMLIQRRQEWSKEIREKIISMVLGKAEQERKMIEEILTKTQQEKKIRDNISTKELSSLITAIFHGLFLFQINELYPVDFTKHIDFIFDAFEKELKAFNDCEH